MQTQDHHIFSLSCASSLPPDTHFLPCAPPDTHCLPSSPPNIHCLPPYIQIPTLCLMHLQTPTVYLLHLLISTTSLLDTSKIVTFGIKLELPPENTMTKPCSFPFQSYGCYKNHFCVHENMFTSLMAGSTTTI